MVEKIQHAFRSRSLESQASLRVGGTQIACEALSNTVIDGGGTGLVVRLAVAGAAKATVLQQCEEDAKVGAVLEWSVTLSTAVND